MRSTTDGRGRSQICFLKRRSLQECERLCREVLSKELVLQNVATSGVVWEEWVESPLVTLWGFLGRCSASTARAARLLLA